MCLVTVKGALDVSLILARERHQRLKSCLSASPSSETTSMTLLTGEDSQDTSTYSPLAPSHYLQKRWVYFCFSSSKIQTIFIHSQSSKYVVYASACVYRQSRSQSLRSPWPACGNWLSFWLQRDMYASNTKNSGSLHFNTIWLEVRLWHAVMFLMVKFLKALKNCLDHRTPRFTVCAT